MSPEAESMAVTSAGMNSAPLLRSVTRFPSTGFTKPSVAPPARQPRSERRVVGKESPRPLREALNLAHLQVAHVNAVQRKERKPCREALRVPAERLLEHFREAELALENRGRGSPPVVEIAGHDEGSADGHRLANPVAEPFELEAAAPRPKAEVDV